MQNFLPGGNAPRVLPAGTFLLYVNYRLAVVCVGGIVVLLCSGGTGNAGSYSPCLCFQSQVLPLREDHNS